MHLCIVSNLDKA